MDHYCAPPHVLRYYPRAVKSEVFLQAFLRFVQQEFKLSECRVATMLSICSDDLNSDSLPQKDLIGPFFLGGLDGYPFVGKTGIGAFSHHIPQPGVALIFFGPHIGITQYNNKGKKSKSSEKGIVGQVQRQGQAAPSACCGAAQLALQHLEKRKIIPKKIHEYDLQDFQQETLEQIALQHEGEILSAGPPGSGERLLSLTEVIYRSIRTQMLNLLTKVEFHQPAFAFGGVLINEDGGQKSDIEFRDAYYLHSGEIETVTTRFNQNAEARFRAVP
ncbi:MAG: hypothetical protein JSS02_09145 [Planctomycetes bacterium]|nr:hypothetical protein [Planctomycetota bacterium]